MNEVKKVADAVVEQLEQAVHGKASVLRLVLTCLLAEGHLLIEDVPGTAKTLLAKALARTLGGKFRRLQCTPDLLPGDVTGTHVFNQKVNEFEFHPGPVFANILLADEINRATPRAQAALLECMAERQVSIENKTYVLERPFFVIATQNPIEHEGTFALPEAQLDRFLMRTTVGYPSREAEVQMLQADAQSEPLSKVKGVLSADVLVQIQQHLRNVHVDPAVRDYIISVVNSTRVGDEFVLGASPRATKGLYRACQALAAITGRNYVIPDDVKRLYPSILNHRVILSVESRLKKRSVEQAVDYSVDMVPAPIVGVKGYKGSAGT